MPGTFRPPADDDTQQSTVSTVTEENIHIARVDSVSTSVTVTAEVKSTTKVSIFAVGGTLFYTTTGVSGGIIFSFIAVCILIGCSVRKKRKSQLFITDTTLQTNNGIQKLMQDRIICYSIYSYNNNRSSVRYCCIHAIGSQLYSLV